MIGSSKAHLAEMQESYVEHLHSALLIASLLARAALACAFHAIVPGLFTRSASRRIGEVQSIFSSRQIDLDQALVDSRHTGAMEQTSP